MALVVETGEGVPGAESYASIASADAYWAKRPQSPFAAAWAAATVELKEGALREASGYMDAELGQLYPGVRKSAEQGLMCPRIVLLVLIFDGFPRQIPEAAIELAARALKAPLAPDVGVNGWVKKTRTRIEGVVDKEIEYGAAGPQDGAYGAVFRSLSDFLIAQPPAGVAAWNWR